MASSKVGLPEFVHGTWTLDGYMIQLYSDEASARRYHQDVLDQGAVNQPCVRNIAWDVAEAGADSGTLNTWRSL